MKIADVIRPLFERVETISKQAALDRNMFGPVYHGSSDEGRAAIGADGFKVMMADSANGYDMSNYALGLPPPLHHLGFGVYLTTVKAIAKMYNRNSVRGLVEYYVNAPRLETINFAAQSTMMAWWRKNGYDFEWPGGVADFSTAAARHARYAATIRMTNTLKSKFDAVWFKGRTIRRSLDGDQVCVYDPRNIFKIDASLSSGFDIGAKVVHNQERTWAGKTDFAGNVIEFFEQPDPMTGGIAILRSDTQAVLHRIPPPGMKGVIVSKAEIKPEHRRYLAPRFQNSAKYRVSVKWAKGGTQDNYLDTELEPVPGK